MMTPETPSQEFAANALSIRLLGNMEIHVRDQALAKPSYEKGRALLAYLAAESGWHPREKLASLLWPGLHREAARNNLRLVLLNLRQCFQDHDRPIPLFLTDRHALGINPDLRAQIDIIRFESAPDACDSPSPDRCDACAAQMEQAVELYRGDFLENFFLCGCPEFEDWLLVRREEMRRHALDLLERLAARFEHAGMHAKALPHTLRAMKLEPWNEAGYRRAMRLYAALGQVKAALGQYDACLRALKENLDAQPDEETRLLAERIRSAASASEAGASISSVTASTTPSMPSMPSTLAEWRKVTVAYCKAIPHAPAESDQAIMSLDRFKARCSDVFQRFEGHVALPYIGGVFAYFGYPRANENAARQAVQAVLAVMKDAGGDDLDIRAGVHTGLIATGIDRTIPDASGLTSAFAMSLHTAACHGEVAVSAETHRLVAGFFECSQVVQREMPGMPGVVDLFTIRHDSAAAGD